MEYDKILKLALIPSIVFLLLSLVSVALTTHYWIIGDWILSRGVEVPTNNFDERLQQYQMDDTMVWYIGKDTDVTIASGCLNLTAAVVALIAWSTLRKPGMDSQYAAGKRRFWVIAVVVMTVSGAATALASIVLHYTEKGDNDYGCTSETLMMAGKLNTNQFCTREMAACNFLPKFIKAGERGDATVACNETIIVKWFQLVLIINGLLVFSMFGIQARLRRQTRDSRETSSKEALSDAL